MADWLLEEGANFEECMGGRSCSFFRRRTKSHGRWNRGKSYDAGGWEQWIPSQLELIKWYLECRSSVMDVMQAPSVMGRLWHMYELPVDVWPWLGDFGIEALQAQLRDRFAVADVSELCELASEHGSVEGKLADRMDRLRRGYPYRVIIDSAWYVRELGS